MQWITRRWFALSVVGFAAYSAYWIWGDRQIPVEHPQTNLLTKNVVRGSALTVEYFINRTRNCPTRVERTIIDGAGIAHPVDDKTFRFQGPPGPDHFVRVQLVPMTSTPGPSKYRVVLIYRCNFFQRFVPLVDPLKDQDFMILDK